MQRATLLRLTGCYRDCSLRYLLFLSDCDGLLYVLVLLLKFLLHVAVSLPVEVEVLSRGVFDGVGLLVVQLAFEAAQDSWALWRSVGLIYRLICRLSLAAA